MTNKQNTITIGIGYKKDIAYFHFREITMDEEEAFTTAMALIEAGRNDVSKLKIDKAIETASEWVSAVPTKRPEIDSEPYLDGEHETPAAAVLAYFERLTNHRDRLATTLIGGYRSALIPDVVFP